MIKKRWLSAMVATMSLAMVLAGCSSAGKDQGNQATGGGNKAAEKPKQLTLATGGTSGTYYALGGGIAKILTDKAKLNTNNQSTGASVENLRLIKNGDVQIAFVQGDIADYAAKGTEMFQKEGAIKNFKALANLYPETVQLVVPANSDIKSVADLKGKRVSVGSAGSGTELNAKQLLEVYGLKFEDLQLQRLSFGDSASAIKDGKLDAAFVTSGIPTAAVTELGATKGVRIINIDDEHFKTLKEKYPFYTQVTIPAKTYNGQDTEIKTVAVQAILVVPADLDEQVVYDITKTLFENLDELGKVHAKGKEVKLETAIEGVTVEFHPGALKYYTEKGVKK